MNPIRARLKQHGAGGYGQIEKYEAHLYQIYIHARMRIETQLERFMADRRSSFTGPRLVKLMEEIQEVFPEFEEQYRETYEHALSYMAKKNYQQVLYDMGLDEPVYGKLDKSLYENMRDDAFTHIAGATRNMEKEIVSNLRKMSAQVMREAALTGETRAAVSRRLAFANQYGSGSIFQRPGNKATFVFRDAANREWKTDAYFKMLGRTLLHNNSRETYIAACAKEGNDIVTVSVSGNSCDHCRQWENRLLSISGKTPGLPTLSAAMSSGLFHPNCTHRIIAVPESVARKYYDAKGKEIPETKATVQTGKAAPQGNTSSVNETHEEHLKRRKKQWMEAYDNRRDKWHQSILDAGGSKEVAGELADLYTPEMAKLGKPPEIAFSYETPSYNNFQKKLSLNMHTEYDKPSVRTHEFTHWWHYQIQRKYPEIREELKAAAAKDFERIKKMYSANKADYRFSNQSALDKIAKNMFRVEKWDSLTKEEQNSAKNFFNSVGSISSGKFGGMHGKTAETIDDPKENKAYFTDQNTNKNRIAFGEVIAELGEEENNPDGKLRLAFKETWAIFQKYRNMR